MLLPSYDRFLSWNGTRLLSVNATCASVNNGHCARNHADRDKAVYKSSSWLFHPLTGGIGGLLHPLAPRSREEPTVTGRWQCQPIIDIDVDTAVMVQSAFSCVHLKMKNLVRTLLNARCYRTASASKVPSSELAASIRWSSSNGRQPWRVTHRATGFWEPYDAPPVRTVYNSTTSEVKSARRNGWTTILATWVQTRLARAPRRCRQ